jgi:hypothetical protein
MRQTSRKETRYRTQGESTPQRSTPEQVQFRFGPRQARSLRGDLKVIVLIAHLLVERGRMTVSVSSHKDSHCIYSICDGYTDPDFMNRSSQASVGACLQFASMSDTKYLEHLPYDEKKMSNIHRSGIMILGSVERSYAEFFVRNVENEMKFTAICSLISTHLPGVTKYIEARRKIGSPDKRVLLRCNPSRRLFKIFLDIQRKNLTFHRQYLR